jgi:hypothetical protein
MVMFTGFILSVLKLHPMPAPIAEAPRVEPQPLTE